VLHLCLRGGLAFIDLSLDFGKIGLEVDDVEVSQGAILAEKAERWTIALSVCNQLLPEVQLWRVLLSQRCHHALSTDKMQILSFAIKST
jgi:hypothetical protein